MDKDNVIGKIITAIVLIGVFGSLIGPLIGLAFAAAPFIGFWVIMKKIFGIGKSSKGKQQAMENTRERQYATVTYNDQTKRKTHSPLPRSKSKRRKIVANCNEKFDLTLTEEEIDRIVDASYASVEWEVEVYAMSQDYDSINEWYKGMTGFLRAYIRAFAVQQITSDFRMQEKICMDSFDQIFREIHPETYPSIDACVRAINDKYMTLFDEATFMIAYRFLQSRGRNYQLPSSSVAYHGSELEQLKEKYDNISETSNTGEDALAAMSRGYDSDINALADKYDQMPRNTGTRAY